MKSAVFSLGGETSPGSDLCGPVWKLWAFSPPPGETVTLKHSSGGGAACTSVSGSGALGPRPPVTRPSLLADPRTGVGPGENPVAVSGQVHGTGGGVSMEEKSPDPENTSHTVTPKRQRAGAQGWREHLAPGEAGSGAPGHSGGHYRARKKGSPRDGAEDRTQSVPNPARLTVRRSRVGSTPCFSGTLTPSTLRL